MPEVRLVEDSRSVGPDQEPHLLALFCDTQMPESGIQLTIDMAKRNYVPVILDNDGNVQAAEILHQRFSAEGVRVIRAQQCYPLPGETGEQYTERFSRNVPSCLIRPLFTHGHDWTEAQVADCNLRLDAIIAANAHVIFDLGYGLDKPPRSEWCRVYFQRLVDATPGPGPMVRLTPPPIVVVPPVEPPVEPPPPVGKWAKLVIVLRKLFGRRRK